MRDLNLGQLQTFLDVTELGSFTAAADRIGITQPAVSLQIRQLEKKLGLRLVERVGKTVRPTQAGLVLIDHARRIGGDVETAISELASFSSDQGGRVRLGTGATACIHLLPPVFRQLKERFPSLQITVKTGDTRDILKEIEDNTLDIAFVTLPISGRMFSVTPILEDEFVFVSAADDAQLSTSIGADELTGLPLILYEAGGHTRTLVDGWLASAGVSIAPVMDLGSVEAIKGLVSAGLGCAILPKSGVGEHPDQSGLSIRSLAPRLARELAVVTRNDKPRHKGLREMEAALNALGGSD
ncbi:LysR family transcriptional regulator [Roseobacter sp. A03A-229]